MHCVKRLGRAAHRLADGGRRQHEVLAGAHQNFLAVQAGRVGRIFGIDRDAASRVVQVDGSELVVQPAVDAHFRRAHLVFAQVGRRAVGCPCDYGDVGIPSRRSRHIGVFDRQRRQRLRRPSAARVDAVHAEARGFGGGVERADVSLARQVGAVVFGKAAVGVNHHVVDAQVQRAAVFNIDLGVGTGRERPRTGHVVAEQLDVSAARTQVQNVQEIGCYAAGGHDDLGTVLHRLFFGQAFPEQRGEIKAQFGLNKGAHFGHIAVTRQLVIQPVDIGTGRSGQVFIGDGVANVAFTLQNRSVQANHQPLLVAKAGLERTVQHSRVAQVFARTAVVAADADKLAQLAGPVADLAFAFNHQRTLDTAQLDGAAGADCGGVNHQGVVQVERGVGMGIDRNRYRRVVEQVDAGGDKMLVAVEVAVLPGQQAEVFSAYQFSASAQGNPVVDIGRGVGVALGCSGQAIGLGHGIGFDVDVGQCIDRRFAIHLDVGVVSNLCIGIGRADDFGVDQGDRDDAAHIHLAERRAAHFVVGAQLQQAFKPDVGIAADARASVAVELGVNVSPCAAEHAATAAFGALLAAAACQVVGGENAQTISVKRRAIQKPGSGRAVQRGTGDRAGRAHRCRIDGGRVAVVTHQATRVYGSPATDYQGVAGRHAEIGGYGLVVVDRGLCTCTRHDAAGTGHRVAVDGLVAAGIDLQAPPHKALNVGSIHRHRGVADGAGKGQTQTNKADPDTGRAGIDPHRIGCRDTHITGSGEHSTLRKLYLGDAGVGRGCRGTGSPEQQRPSSGTGLARHRRVTRTEYGRDINGITLESQCALAGDRHFGVNFGLGDRNADGHILGHRHAHGVSGGIRIGPGRHRQRALACVERRAAGQRDTHGTAVTGRRAGAAAGNHASRAACCLGRHAALARRVDVHACAADAAAHMGSNAAALRCRGDHDTDSHPARRRANRFAQHRRLVERRHADQATGINLTRQRC